MDEKLRDHFLELIRRSSTDVPQDVEEALKRGRAAERETKKKLASSAKNPIVISPANTGAA